MNTFRIPRLCRRIAFGVAIIFWCNSYSAEPRAVNLTEDSLNEIIQSELKDSYRFSGLASFYKKVTLYTLTNGKLSQLEKDSKLTLSKEDWLVISGRFEMLAIKGGDFTVTIESGMPQVSFFNQYEGFRFDRSYIEQIDPELIALRYSHLTSPFSVLAYGIESLLVWINSINPFGWGVSIVLLALVLKVLLLPLSLWTAKLQRKVSSTKAILAPQIEVIKSEYSGEAAHSRIVAAHREAGVSLFYALKPMIGTLAQIPILIAVFNALGEMHQLRGESFLWVSDLSYPDSIASLPLDIPLLGYEISLLPFLMTAISIFSSVTFSDKHLGEVGSKRQKLPLYLMAAAFFLLFYPFPAAMVLYWTLNNVFHLVQQRLFAT